MKSGRFIAAAAALCIGIPAAAEGMTAMATPPIDRKNIIAGDANLDQVFNLADIVLFQRWLKGDKGLFTPYNEPCPGADVNNDGKFDVFDLVGMRKLLVNAIVSAPEPEVKTTASNMCTGVQRSPGLTGIAMSGGDSDKDFVDSQTAFALDLFKATYSENKGKNDLVSPYSVSQALGMTANGAEGQTLEEMEKVLGSGMPIETLNRYFRGQRERTINTSDWAKWSFSTANSIWARDDRNRIQVLPTFIQNCVDYYDSEFYIAPFDDTTIEDVNNWVNSKTNGMIPEILKRIDPNDDMYLVNAVAFEAQWSESYEKNMISNGRFTAADGTIQEAEMLSSSEIYISDENTVGFAKDYIGRKYSFAALLPDEDTPIDKYIEELTPVKLNALLKSYGSSFEMASVKLPKFSYEYSNKLNNELSAMGMPTAFSDYADFSGMSAIAYKNPLKIGYVIHKTFIDLDENGTKAAAATLVAMQEKSMPVKPEKEIVLDRPFVYCIFDTETDIPLFMGVLNSLS